MPHARMIGFAVLLAVIVASTAAAAAPGVTVIYSFKGGKSGGAPFSSLIEDTNGALYGTTSGDCGSAFQLSPPAGTGKRWKYQSLHEFTNKMGDGCGPFGGPVASANGVLYGVTSAGGLYGGGAAFSLTPPGAGDTGWSEAVIYSFASPSDPSASLILDPSGVLYGTASLGGQGANGAVFALTPPGDGQTDWTEATLYTFQGGKDGRDPIGGLIEDSSGNLYGTTYYGGTGSLCPSGQGCGTVYRLTPPAGGSGAWTETILYAFTGGNDGAYPYGGMVPGKNSLLYGTTVAGGSANDGVVFNLAPHAGHGAQWAETILYSFTGTGGDGAHPYGNLTANLGGTLFGTTVDGGSACCGTVFQLSPPGGGSAWTETVLAGFQDGPGGAYPYGGVLRDASKSIYGTTFQGGANNSGAIFEIPP